MSGWAHYREEVGSANLKGGSVTYGYGFALAIVVWLFLLAWMPLWIIAHLTTTGEDADTPSDVPAKEEDPAPGVPVSMGAEEVNIEIDENKQASNVEHLDYFDYNVDDEGNPTAVFDKTQKGQFRCAGDSMMSFGFQLTANDKADQPNKQQGHFMCLVEFEASGNEVNLHFEYNMYGATKEEGAGLCAYLLDPSVEGWDTQFDGSGPMGFIGKTGAIVGVALDNTGVFTGDGKADHLTIKGSKPGDAILKTQHIEGGFMTTDEEWKKVHIKFDIKDMNCDVMLNGDKIMDDVEFGDMKIPSKLCVAVCGASTSPEFMLAVNDVKLDDDEEEHHKEVHAAEVDDSTGVPKGCTDYKVENGALVESNEEETWRTAGNTQIEYGFELTQDADDQEGHLLCRQPFEVVGTEIHASLEYVMEPKTYAEEGGQGLCIYLVDPEIPGWDRSFNGTGPLGFVGKVGAILGVGVDCTGTFCEGQPASVAVKRASDSKLLCKAVVIEKHGDAGVTGVRTDEDEWRRVKVKFDIEDMTVDVKIGGHKYLDNVPIDLGEDANGNKIKIPKRVCIGVCAGTADGKNNHICVNDVKLDSEEGDD